MSTQGAIHLAQSANWSAWERDRRAESMVRSRYTDCCTLAEAAAAHDRKPTEEWLAEFYRCQKRNQQ